VVQFILVSKVIFKKQNKYLYVLEELYIRNVIGVMYTEIYISSPDVQKFVQEDRSTFDLVIVESFFQECTIAIGHKYGAPVVSIIPVAPWINPSLLAGNPIDFSYIKDYKFNSCKSLDFENRLINTIFGLYGLLIEPLVYFPRMETMMNTHFRYPGYETRPTMMEMLKNVSLNLIDSDVTILSPRPYVPSSIEVPGIHLKSTKEMGEVYRVFGLDVSFYNFILFNVIRFKLQFYFMYCDSGASKFHEQI